MNIKKTLLSTAIGLAVSGSVVVPLTASAAVNHFDFTGWFAMLDPGGEVLGNNSIFGPGTNSFQTPITGALSFDTVTGAGTAVITPFDFLAAPSAAFTSTGITLQTIGDGFGGTGTLMLANMTFDWNSNVGIPISLVLDAAGFFTNGATQATPASDGTYVGGGLGNAGYLSLGPVLMATTTWNTHPSPACGQAENNTTSAGGGCNGVLPSGGLPLIADTAVNVNKSYGLPTPVLGIGGNPIEDGPFLGFSANFDITGLSLTGTGGTINGGNAFDVGPYPSNAVPVPAAIWLFGSGLIGLVGMARRKKV